MKVFFDIGHPAHVHYFKLLIHKLINNGHEVMVSARNRNVVFDLLDFEGIQYFNRGKGAKSFLGKFIYLIKADLLLFKKFKKFKPDVVVGFASPYASQVAWLLKIPCFTFNDTEHSWLNTLFYKPFSKKIYTPSCYLKNLGQKHIRFNGYMELAYLHPDVYSEKCNIYEILKIEKNEKYIVLRFVSWDANHDFGQKGMTTDYKIRLVNELSEKYKVFISSEQNLPKELEIFKLNIPSNKMHIVLSHAELCISEGATTTSECVMLGTPAIFVNTLKLGYCTELEEKYKLCFNYREQKGVIEKAKELLNNENLKEEFSIKRNTMLSEKINVAQYMEDLIFNYSQNM